MPAMSNSTPESIASAVKGIHQTLGDCYSAWEQIDKPIKMGEPFWADPKAAAESLLEKAFLACIAFLEVTGTTTLLELAKADYQEAKRTGYLKATALEDDPCAEYLVWGERIRLYADAASTGCGVVEHGGVDPSLLAILRNSEYVINDRDLYGNPPREEREVHQRVEAILKAVYRDWLHKPRLAKAVNGFEPDTGIPSLKTLVEYKYIKAAEDVARVAEQILADTRGFASRDWDKVVFVIYESGRFRSEDQWNQLLASCEVAGNANVVVIHGEAVEGSTVRVDAASV